MPSKPLKKSQQPQQYGQNKPWKALYKGKWYEVIDEEDQGRGQKNKYYLRGVPGGPVSVEDIDPFGIGGSSSVNKEAILAVLAKRYQDKTRAALESVATDIYYSGEPAAVLASSKVIDDLFTRLNQQKEIDAKKGAAVDSNEFCPICKQATSNVLLASARPAKWCLRHFVVFPVKGKDEK